MSRAAQVVALADGQSVEHREFRLYRLMTSGEWVHHSTRPTEAEITEIASRCQRATVRYPNTAGLRIVEVLVQVTAVTSREVAT